MSTNASNETQASGYVLPEGAQRRLRSLQEYVNFLSYLLQPRRANETATQLQPGELGSCLEQLEKRVAKVMEALSPLVEDEAAASAAEAETEAETEAHAAAHDSSGTDAEAASIPRSPSGERYTSGVTLEQIDQINLLLESLHAIGNVVCCADHAEYSKATLAVMGDAIYRDVDTIHDILDTIHESQHLGPKHTLNSVREERASYLASTARSPASGSSYHAQPHPTYQ